MATTRFNFPDGARLALATAFTVAKPVTSITNAAPPVASSAAHGLANGDIVLIDSGWQEINERAARVAATAAGTFALAGLNTTNLAMFPAGEGIGSVRSPSTWAQIPRILEVATTGGDPSFWTGGYLEDDRDTQIPVGEDPQSMQLTLGDWPGSARDTALLAATIAREVCVLRLTLKDGAIILYTAYVSYNDTPQMSRRNPMSTRATLSLVGRPTRYAAPTAP